MRTAVPSVTNGCEGEHKLSPEELFHLYSPILISSEIESVISAPVR
jgi:hypothetical protein